MYEYIWEYAKMYNYSLDYLDYQSGYIYKIKNYKKIKDLVGKESADKIGIEVVTNNGTTITYIKKEEGDD